MISVKNIFRKCWKLEKNKIKLKKTYFVIVLIKIEKNVNVKD